MHSLLLAGWILWYHREVKPESTLLGSECDQVNHPPHQVQSLPLRLLISAGVTSIEMEIAE